MLLHKKIRFLRLNKGWSQETMAEKLAMSPNGYGSIERGETNVQLSRVLQIAKLFDINTAELFQDGNGKENVKNVPNSIAPPNVEIQNDNNARCYFGTTELSQKQYECQREREQLEFNVEKQIIIIEQKDREIYFLKQLNELLTAAAAAKLAPSRVKRDRFNVLEDQRIEKQHKENVKKSTANLNNC